MKLRSAIRWIALSSSLAACGAGGAQVADAGVPDAAANAAGADAGGGNGTPFTLLNCEAPRLADAGLGAPDAGASLDAGPGPGLDESCCQPEGECAPDFACIEGPSSAAHNCRPHCNLADGLCPTGGVCASFGGQGVCIEAGEEGDACAPELCTAANICVGDTADDALCRRRCEDQGGCDPGTTCTAITASGMACLPD